MKRLYLIRNPRQRLTRETNLADYHQPLTRRGELAAKSIGSYMLKKSFAPDLVLCASPTRTRQTLANIWPLLPTPPELTYDYRIHLERGEALLERLRQTGNRYSHVMMISIAPGINDLARLIYRPCANTPNPFSQDMPPGALAVFDCDISSWDELAPAGAKLVELTAGTIF